MPINACTIISKNYLAFARVLAASFRRHQPGGRFFVLLVDRLEGYFDPAAEDFELIEVETLDAERPGGKIDELRSFMFKYSLLEVNTAVKPFLLEYLLERHPLENLVYFDPDILITRPLDELEALLGKHSIILTPHLTEPIDDKAHPNEQVILQSGAFNLGFIALRNTEVTAHLLAWWQDRLYDRCVLRFEEALFVDQKWMDLAPGLFKDVYILTAPGYNVAYWNLHGRPVSFDEAGPRAASEPLYFFHFSGFNPEMPEQVSKHQDRHTPSNIGPAAQLFDRYRELLFEAGYREAIRWPYAFARFDNGARIPDVVRRLYLDQPRRRRRRFGDPFVTAGEHSFFAWLNEPVDPKAKQPPYLSRLLYERYLSRPDLVRNFPDVAGRDFYDFCSWFQGFGHEELQLDPALTATLHTESRATLFTLGGLKRRLRNRAKRVYHSRLGKRLRQLSKGVLGHEQARELRERLLPSEPAQPERMGKPRVRLAPPEEIARPGINVVGYLQAETGMGQGARALARALATTGIAHAPHSLSLNVRARSEDFSFEPATGGFPYDINLFFVNADQTGQVLEHLGPEAYARRYNIGFWLWELEVFPEQYRPAFDCLHEIWTPSSFCVEAISRVSPIPVRRVPLPVEVELDPRLDRAHFGFPEGVFVFLFMFNYLSFFERKNPLAIVEAFRKAFGNREDVLLVLKTSQSDFAPEAHQQLVAASRGANVRIVDEYLGRPAIDAMVGACDAYVSLHRSEGYGLTLAEAMVLGKPVIATPYSGVSDFFDLNNGYPVRYRTLELEQDHGPYRAGSHWADPDVAHAAEQMKAVVERREEARKVGQRASEDLGRKLSYTEVGKVLRARYEEVLRTVRQGHLGGWL